MITVYFVERKNECGRVHGAQDFCSRGIVENQSGLASFLGAQDQGLFTQLNSAIWSSLQEYT